MAKIELSDISSGYNLSKVNENFQKIEDALNDEVLYRDNPVGEDNALQTNIDANNKRILNLPDPVSASEPIRKQEWDQTVGLAEQYRDEAEGFKDETEDLRDDVIDLLDQLSPVSFRGDYNTGILYQKYDAVFDAGEVLSSPGAWYIATQSFTSTDIASDVASGYLQVYRDKSVIYFDSLIDVQSMTFTEGQQVSIAGYHAGSTVGGGLFVWATGRHDGGSFIDTSRAFPTDWNDQAQLEAWFEDSGGDVVGFTRISNDLTLPDFGFYNDGLTDNSLIIQEVLSIGNISTGAGDFYFGSNSLLDFDLVFSPNSMITVGVGATFTVVGEITAQKRKIFNGDGSFECGDNCRTPEIFSEWFGIVRDDQTGAVPDDNMRSIYNAIEMASAVGMPNGVYKTPNARLPLGLVYVDDHDSDGVGAYIRSYCSIFGYGDNTTIRPKDNAKAFDVFALVDDGANSWALDYCQIYGEWSLQTNTQNAISIRPPLSAAIYGYIGHQIYIKEMSGRSISITGEGVENCEIVPRLIRDSVGHNMYVTAARNTLFDTKSRSAKSGSYGAVFETANVIGNTIKGFYDENNAGGLLLSNTGTRNSVDVSANTNGGNGVFLDRCDNLLDARIVSYSNALSGLVTDKLDNCNFSLISTSGNGQWGNANYDMKDSLITSVNSHSNGTSANDTYANFALLGDSDNNLVDSIICRAGVGANKVQYNIHFGSQTNTNKIGDYSVSGAVTQDIFDEGTGNTGV